MYRASWNISICIELLGHGPNSSTHSTSGNVGDQRSLRIAVWSYASVGGWMPAMPAGKVDIWVKSPDSQHLDFGFATGRLGFQPGEDQIPLRAV